MCVIVGAEFHYVARVFYNTQVLLWTWRVNLFGTLENCMTRCVVIE